MASSDDPLSDDPVIKILQICMEVISGKVLKEQQPFLIKARACFHHIDNLH